MSDRSGRPPPPRPVAPVATSDVQSSGSEPPVSRGYVIAGVLVAAVGLALVLVVLVAAQRGDSAVDVAAALRAAGCTLRVVEADDPRPHLTRLDARVEHNTFPPTNGPHYVFWAPWALYRTPVNQLQLVHNLEHGGIVIQIGDRVANADVSRVVSFYYDDPNALVVAPLQRLGGRISLQAWTSAPPSERSRGDFGEGRLALCTEFDKTAFAAFRDAYRLRGPEQVNPEALKPGS